MKRQLFFLFAAVLALPAAAADAVREIALRAYYHDPVRPAGVIRCMDANGKLEPLALMSEGLSASCRVRLEKDELILYRTTEEIAARVKVAASVSRAAVIIVPSPAAGATPPLRLVVLDDSPGAFPWGSSLAVSLLAAETAVQAGEHRLILRGGKVTAIPEVKQADEFNMAQTNFLYREGTRWVPFTERRLKHVADLRRIFLIHATPGSQRPFVATLTDYPPPPAP